MMKRRKVARRLIVILGAMMMMILMVHAKKTPEASSTLLKMHRLYMSQPPHDDSLYNILSVSPNATQAEITKSYRRLTRALHPDKHHPRHSSHFTQQEREERLQQVQEAYEVLKDDSTRLPYHRFGLLDTSFAAFLLTGGRVQGTTISPSQDQERLLQMMGFYHTKQTHQQVCTVVCVVALFVCTSKLKHYFSECFFSRLISWNEYDR
jgi:curved DNA-binding protein CbpA